MSKIGTEIVEGTANVLQAGLGGDARVIGLAVEASRGVDNKPVFVGGLKEYEKRFAGYDLTMFSPFVVKNMFNNLDGFSISLFVLRIVGVGSVAATATVSDSGNDIADFTAGYQGDADKGVWANGMEVTLYPIGVTGGSPDNYVCEVTYNGEVVERKEATTLQELEGVINLQSGYVTMSEGAAGYGTAFAAALTATFSGGVYNAPVEADFEPTYNVVTGDPEGIAIFEKTNVNVIAAPEFFTTNLATKCDVWCKDNKRFFIYNLPKDANATVVEAHHTATKTANRSFIAKYLEWVRVDDEIGGKIWIPSIGYVFGAGFVRTAAKDGDVVWSVPAGENSYAVGIYEFSHLDLNEATKERYVTTFLTNLIKYSDSLGYTLVSSRTCSTNILYMSIHIRLETNWLVKQLKSRNAKFTEKLNTPKLRNDMLLDTRTFFKMIYDKGGIEQSIPFENAVIISVETNPDNRKWVDEDINWVPPEVVEYQRISLNRNDGVLNIVG